MNVTATLAALHRYQVAFYTLTLLELTGYLFPPPALLKNNDTFDYIIIGCGTTGAVIATRLVQKEYNVLVVEAGEDAPYESTLPGLVAYLKNSHVDWNYTSIPDGYSYQCQTGKVLDLGIAKMLGGSGELNYMIYSRGNEENFDEWSKIVDDPIWNWENVLPYFKKSENVSDSAIRDSDYQDFFGSHGYVGVTRDQDTATDPVLEGFREIGKDIIPDIDGNRIGYSKALMTINNGMRQGAGPLYLRYISESRYIAMAKKSLATRVIWDKNKTAKGVELITDEGKKIVVNARKEVIISAGAIKSPQLLMLSGIGRTEELMKFNIRTVSNLPVGKNLRDHVAVLIPHKTNQPAVQSTETIPGKFPAGVFVGYASLNESANHKKFPDYTVIGHVFDDLTFLQQFCASTYKFSEGSCNKLIAEANNNKVIVSLIGDLYASSRGEVTLRSSDPKDPPNVLPDSFSYDRDLINMIDYIMDYLKVEDTEAFKNLGATKIDLTIPRCDALKNNRKHYWRCYILCMMVSLRSFGGTCAMGSVVDSRLKVIGVNNLRVADTSIMPNLVTGVTYNTALMIGEKAADIIIEDAGVEYNSMEHEMIRPDQVRNMPI